MIPLSVLSKLRQELVVRLDPGDKTTRDRDDIVAAGSALQDLKNLRRLRSSIVKSR